MPVLAKIKKIEFLKFKPVSYNFGFVVDNVPLTIPFHYKAVENDEYYVAANPRYGIFSATNIHHEWDRFSGELYIKTPDNTEMRFTIGSDTALVNGKEEKLKKPFYLFDHMPVLPLRFVFDKGGLAYEIKDNTIFVKVR